MSVDSTIDGGGDLAVDYDFDARNQMFQAFCAGGLCAISAGVANPKSVSDREPGRHPEPVFGCRRNDCSPQLVADAALFASRASSREE